MRIDFKKLILFTILVYGALFITVSEQCANFLLAISIILYIVIFVLKSIFNPWLYKYAYRIVPKEFVKDKHTLINQLCIIKYLPGNKLSVEDNLNANQRREKRIFTIYKYKTNDMDKCWYEICATFDDYTYFDSLASYVSKITPIKIKLISTASEEKPGNMQIQNKEIKQQKQNDISTNKVDNKKSEKQSEFISINEISPDKFGVENLENCSDDNYFVDLENIKKINDDVD